MKYFTKDSDTFDISTQPNTSAIATNSNELFFIVRETDSLITSANHTLSWISNWIYWISALEELLIDYGDKYLRCEYTVDYEWFNDMTISKVNTSTGIKICKNKTENFKEHKDINYLEGAQSLLRENYQFLKIFTTYSDTLFVYTNKHLTWEQLTKIKALEYSYMQTKGYSINNILIELMNAFVNNNCDMINECLTNLKNSKIIDNKKFEQIVKAFDYKNTRKIDTLKSSIQSRNDLILEFENRIATEATLIREENERLEYMLNKKVNEEERLIIKSYLMNHPYIKEVKNAGRGKLTLYYEAPILYFEDYVIERIIKNANITEKKILNAFIDRRYTLYTRCRLLFYTEDFNLSVEGGLGANENFIGHPHIDRYGCLGNHRTEVRKTAQTNDYICAFDQITQAVLNLNFTDSCVINRMYETLQLYDDRPTWYDNEEHKFITTRELLERM